MKVWVVAMAMAWGGDPVEDLTPPPEPPPAAPMPVPEEEREPLEGPRPPVDYPYGRIDLRADPIDIVVIAERRIKLAREEVIEEMAELGWDAVAWRADEVVFEPPQPWMGRARLTPDGLMYFRRPVFKFGRAEPEVPQYRTDQVLDRDDRMGTVDTVFYILPDRRKLAHAEQAVLDLMEEPLRRYREARQDEALAQALAVLPHRLDRLWATGEPLVGEDPLETMEERRLAVLEFWAGRAGTPEGQTVSEAIEAWLQDVVQPSDHPVTRQERRAAERARADNRRLRLR